MNHYKKNMRLFNFFKIKHECSHNKVSADVEEAYCPDCGALVQNKWFLVRCSCCNIKRIAHRHYDEIVPDTKFCKNCGSSDYYIQELENLNFTDVRYAVFKKIIITNQLQNISTRQIWVEEANDCKNHFTETKPIPVLNCNSKINEKFCDL